MKRLRFDWRRLRAEWKSKQSGLPLDFLLIDTSPELEYLRDEFVDVYVTFGEIEQRSERYIIRGTLGIIKPDAAERTGFHYLITLDVRDMNNAAWLRRSVLHELRHILQHRAGYDLTEANPNGDGDFTRYKGCELECDAIEHEQIKTWIERRPI